MQSFINTEALPIEAIKSSSRKYGNSYATFLAQRYHNEVLKPKKVRARSYFQKTEEQKLDFKFFEKSYFTEPLVKGVFWNLTLRRDAENNTENIHRIEAMIDEILRDKPQELATLNKIPVNKVSTKIVLYQRLQNAKDFIDKSFDTKLSLRKLAEEACLSEHHFLRHFKTAFDITPHQYITQKRLEKARILLLNTEASISEISEQIGMDNLSSFSRLFKKHHGVSPEKYRKNQTARIVE